MTICYCLSSKIVLTSLSFQDSILETQVMSFPTTCALTLYDCGSTVSLVTHALADKLNLPFCNCCFELSVAGGDTIEYPQGRLYLLTLNDRNDNKWIIECFGLDHLTQPLPAYDATAVHNHFPHVPEEIFKSPRGDVRILLGKDQVHLMPHGGSGHDQYKKLRTLRSQFYPGWVFTRQHQDRHW